MNRWKALCLLLLFAAPGFAVVMTVDHENLLSQDFLYVPDVVDELGWNPPFPQDETITSGDIEVTFTPCLENEDNPGIPNILVNITNLTGRAWRDVWYVADPETTLQNYDGLVNGELAFKIDDVGANIPLVSESMNPDKIFEIGETWEFVIQDYVNINQLPASLFGTIGVGGQSGGDRDSSGSIIVIPEPMTLALLALGGCLIRKR